MSLREEDKPKTGTGCRGLGLAAAAIGVGIGAALYYIFSKEESQEIPNAEGATSAQCNVESPQTLTEDHNSSNDYTTISEHTTSDTSMCDNAHNSSSSDHADDFYHPSSDLDADEFNPDWTTIESDTDGGVDTHDDTSSSSPGSDADNESNSDPLTNEFDMDSRDDPSPSSSSESNAINSDPLTNEPDMDTRDDPSSSESVVSNETDNSGRPFNWQYRPRGPFFELPPFNPVRISTVHTLADRNDNPGNNVLDEWEIESSLGVPHFVPPSSSPINNYGYRFVTRQPANSRERSWSLEECSICFEVILKNQEVMSLPCTHLFHQSCILPWLQEQQTCPNCRKSAD